MKIAFCNNNLIGLYLFRKDVIKHFRDQGHEILILHPLCLDEPSYLERLSKYGKCIAINMAPNSQNLIRDFKLYFELRRVYQEEKPDIVFNFTIKPNIYSALAAHSSGIRTVDMMAGLGYVFDGDSLKKKVARVLYKIGLSVAEKVIVLNQDNYDTVVDKYVDRKKLILFQGGEGVNMEEYPYKPNHFESTRFLMVARLLYDKGYQQFVDAARIVKQKCPEVQFDLLGGFSEDSPSGVPRSILEKNVQEGVVNYLGETQNVPSFVLQDGTVVVVASYYMEGMNRALMEACSMGRPIITTNMPGCKEMVDDGVNGFCVEPRNAQSLAEACLKFLSKCREEKEKMALASYEKCKKQFDVKLVICNYEKILGLFS